jgi:hypothetical protein
MKQYGLGLHYPHAIDLTGGQMILPGEVVKLDPKVFDNDEHNKRYLDEKILIEIPDDKKEEGDGKTRN